MEDTTSFLGHHISATFELRAGVVKAEARRVERSESLDDVRAQLDADVMADADRVRKQKSASKVQCVPCVICDEYATNNALANGAQISHRFDSGLRHRHRGVAPPGAVLGTGQAAKSGGCSRPRSISDSG
jgi:hypothetical protein